LRPTRYKGDEEFTTEAQRPRRENCSASFLCVLCASVVKLMLTRELLVVCRCILTGTGRGTQRALREDVCGFGRFSRGTRDKCAGQPAAAWNTVRSGIGGKCGNTGVFEWN